MPGFYKQIFCDQNDKFSIIINDDDNVAYAYLLQDGCIIGDVWLYNRMPAPLQTNWEKKDDMRFLNPGEYIREEIAPIEKEDEIYLEWSFDHRIKEVKIFIRDIFVAKLAPGSQPGWSTLVRKSGPLARQL